MICIDECKDMIFSTEVETKFLEIYMDPALLSYERERYIRAIERYREIYGEDQIEIFSAPGRTEVMGNHTDHQHGEVIAASINRDAIAVAHPTGDEIIRITSGDFPQVEVDLRELSPFPGKENGTKSIIKGVVKGCLDRGYKVGGFCAYVTSDVLIGAGLSSSAAFETLIGTILSGLFNDESVPAEEIAMIGQYAENVYFGKPCGLMDQMACSVGGLIHIDFKDPEKAAVERLDFDLCTAGYSLCITDTKSSHNDLTAEYAAIPREMKEIAGFFGREFLLGTTVQELIVHSSELRGRYGDRAFLRAIHFVMENERVGRAVEALHNKNVSAFLEEVRQSGKSSAEVLQNVYVSSDVIHQNVSVALAVSGAVLDPQTSAYRVHGGGFAGTIQAFLKNEDVSSYKETMDSVFGRDACQILKIRLTGGTKAVG
ncbi:MAG: galactokinase [Clostridiales bacterium]|nr:galactokinase [Clostridiales bacterium]